MASKPASITSKYFDSNLVEEVEGTKYLRTTAVFEGEMGTVSSDAHVHGFDGVDWIEIGNVDDALKVNISNAGLEFNINGLYNVGTNPTPDTIALVASTTAAATGLSVLVQGTSFGALKTSEENGTPQHFNNTTTSTGVVITPSNTTKEIWLSVPMTNPLERSLEISFDGGTSWFGPFSPGEKASLKTEVASFRVRGDDAVETTAYQILCLGK